MHRCKVSIEKHSSCASGSLMWPQGCFSSDGACPESCDDSHLWTTNGEDKATNHLLQCLSNTFQLRGMKPWKRSIFKMLLRQFPADWLLNELQPYSTLIQIKCQAASGLSNYEFLQCLWGLSLNIKEADVCFTSSTKHSRACTNTNCWNVFFVSSNSNMKFGLILGCVQTECWLLCLQALEGGPSCRPKGPSWPSPCKEPIGLTNARWCSRSSTSTSASSMESVWGLFK